MFTGPSGEPIRPDSATHALEEVAERVGLKGVRLHDLRHAAANALLRAKVHPRVVSGALGHATTAFTMDVYSHLLDDAQDESAAALEAAYAGRG